MIVLHAVVPRDGDAAGLQKHVAGDVAVLYEETADTPSRERTAIIGEGARILELARNGPVLPMRYGTAVTDASELAAVVEDKADAWRRRLVDLEGHVELLVHVVTDDGTRIEGESGANYLRRRAAAVRRRDRALDAVISVLVLWCRELRVLPDRQRVAALVPRDNIDVVRHALDSWAGHHRDVGIAVTGPWPPFSFCEELETP